MAKGEIAKLVSLGAVATAIGGAYKVGEFMYKAKRVRDVGPANAVYVRLIRRVRADLDEVKRLLTVPEVEDALRANPPKAKWVHGAMRDVRGALENITPLTERVAGDIDDGRRVGLRHRIRWLLSEKEKLENREKELLVAHTSLNEVIGFLTALEPADQDPEGKRRDTRVDIEVDRDPRRYEERETYIERDNGPRRVEERDVYIERDNGPRRVEEREVYIERENGPRRVEEREVYIERDNGPRRVEEREVWVDDRRGPRRVEERETWIEHGRERGPRQVEERDVWVERGREPPRHIHEERYYDERGNERDIRLERDPRHVEATYTERGPGRYEEKHYEERFDGRRPRREDEDRIPNRETWMQSNHTQRQPGYGQPYAQYGEYAEYGAPQPYGAAEYPRREVGDPGFGDELVINPQPVPALLQTRSFEREEWIEEKQDYRVDQYGNRLPENLQRTRYPRTRL
ncbi:hypothetical protein EJ04DRAFT_513291 [Polyplosphaeria fusca]|uniref:Uncharacterized protein n=1 Tax=Polyplosphaeria fusca TaxID=682080 RepID=A0A9P4QV65_9PLEO|nr:hypothetical protein EJ04DRAFT_513291 [Polyplosphaeria fusca]